MDIRRPRSFTSVASGLLAVVVAALAAFGVWVIVADREDSETLPAASPSTTIPPVESSSASSSSSSSSSSSTSTTVPSRRLTWAPPFLEDPETVELSTETQTIELEDDRDYILEFPEEPVIGALSVRGGRNVLAIGGEISIPWQGDDPSVQARRGLYLQGQTGVVHLEGLLIGGEDLSEGIQIDAPRATVQLQNIRVERVTARDLQDFSDNHPDVLQPFGGVLELRVDHLTGYTDYQGLFLVGSLDPIGSVDLRNTNIVGTDISRYLLWYSGDYDLELDGVYALPAADRSWDKTVWHPPDWEGAIEGRPPAGDFVTPSDAGLDYESPGYDVAG